jgi:tetratricopeptide (TPR) repeat protein
MKTVLKVSLVLLFVLLAQGSTFVIDATNNAVKHNNAGLEYFHNENYGLAIQEFKLAIFLNPDSAVSATFHNNLGLTYFKIRKYDWAILCFERAIAINPNFFEYYKNLADSYKLNNELNIKYSEYKNLLTKNNKNSAAMLMCGLIQYELNNYKLAIDYLNKFEILESEIILTEAVRDFLAEIEIKIKKQNN